MQIMQMRIYVDFNTTTTDSKERVTTLIRRCNRL